MLTSREQKYVPEEHPEKRSLCLTLCMKTCIPRSAKVDGKLPEIKAAKGPPAVEGQPIYDQRRA